MKFILVYASRLIRAQHGREVWQQVAVRAGSWEFTTLMASMKQGVNQKLDEAMQSQILPPVVYFLQKGWTPKPPQIAPPTGDQSFKYPSLGEAFLFKPAHYCDGNHNRLYVIQLKSIRPH